MKLKIAVARSPGYCKKTQIVVSAFAVALEESFLYEKKDYFGVWKAGFTAVFGVTAPLKATILQRSEKVLWRLCIFWLFNCLVSRELAAYAAKKSLDGKYKVFWNDARKASDVYYGLLKHALRLSDLILWTCFSIHLSFGARILYAQRRIEPWIMQLDFVSSVISLCK